jgi:hypothetical protein
MTQDIARFAAYSQSCAEEISRSRALSFSLLGFRHSHSPSNRLVRAPSSSYAKRPRETKESLASCREQSEHPAKPLWLRRSSANAKHQKRKDPNTNAQSDAPFQWILAISRRQPGRQVRKQPITTEPKRRPSLNGRSARYLATNRIQINWFAAIAGAMISLRVLSSGAIADAASVSVNAMARRRRRGRRISKNSLDLTGDWGRARKGPAFICSN